jgi:diguanylate cyclase (GGDEF)-like protein/PAS domain S-box-containing protein
MANEEFCRLTGYSREEVEHRLFWTAFVPPDELPRVLEVTSRRRNAPETAPRRYETRLMDRTKRLLDVIVCTDLIPGSREQVTSFLDITEIRTVQSALEASERRFREFAESLPQVVFEMDLDGTVLFVNKNAGVTLGYSPEEATNTFNALSIIAPEDRERARKRMEERLRGDDDPSPGEYTGLRKDGSRFPMAVYLRPISLEGRLQGFRGILVDMTRQKELEERLRFYSLHDPLTGLYNRTFFDEELRRLSAGLDDPVGIVICDLDGLKFLNDTMGHSVGDRILAESAHILRKAFRKNDVLARIGGDEFAALLPRCDGNALSHIVETIFREVERHNESNPALPLSVSVGYASGNAGEMRIEALFAAADDDMYRAKNDRREASRHFLLERLRKALDLREFSDGEHLRRLERHLLSLAEPLGIPQEARQLLRSLAHWHDIGMVTVDESIVLRPGPLAPEEWREIRRHPETGARIVASFQDLASLAPWILAHHERWDGAGYPLGLKGEAIPLESRMLALVHAYDAMTSPRPWRPAKSPAEARAELQRCAGTQFDPRIVELFLALPEDSEGERHISADASRVNASS